MEDKKNASDNVEIFGEDSVITLYDDKDQPVEFFEVAMVEYDGKFYEILQPVEPTEGIGEDEGVIFEFAVEDGSGEKMFRPVFDEALLEKVFSQYMQTLADYESCDCGCDCGHDRCGEERADGSEDTDIIPEAPDTKKPSAKKKK